MKLKSLHVGAGLLAVILSSASARAADVVPMDVGYDWSGIYIGAHAGYGWGSVDYQEDYVNNDYDIDETDGFFNGGLFGGFNYQIDSFVLGAEADFGWGGVDIGEDSNATYNDYSAFESDWNGHLRGRVGFAVDRALFYAAGGLAWADLQVDDTDPDWSDDSNTLMGWTIGGGVEYAVTDNLLLRAEYLYDDYGDEEFEFDFGGSSEYSADTSLTASTVRLGIAYKFGL